jgi:hypothetical protein
VTRRAPARERFHRRARSSALRSSTTKASGSARRMISAMSPIGRHRMRLACPQSRPTHVVRTFVNRSGQSCWSRTARHSRVISLPLGAAAWPGWRGDTLFLEASLLDSHGTVVATATATARAIALNQARSAA